MLRKIQTLAVAAALLLAATTASAVPVLYGGNTAPRFFRVDDLTDADPMTSISTSGFLINRLAWGFTNRSRA